MMRKLAIITGGGSGLGKAFCTQLADDGWHVAIADIDLQKATDVLAGIKQRGGSGHVEQLDVADSLAWEQIIDRLREEWPKLDLLVNNAGICGAGKIGEYAMDEFRRILEVNLLGIVHGCHACVPWMIETAPGGHVVNVASIAAALNAPAMAAYNTSKAGVVAFSETLYGELLTSGIGVTVVMPGFFRSQLLEKGTFQDHRLRDIAENYTHKSTFTANDVVFKTLRAIRKKELYVVIGWKARLAWRLKRFAPTLFQKFVSRSFQNDTRKITNKG